ncbi:hypothetical protein ANN_13177 [Periplaneta americana]|uniref:Dipeptidase n=1 Tax=Periplaneta americana TaxID=6978 RepID=A0ABQ8TK27_PERAM|nr:hypothetical protein ANN_13177 [Periplaneta americana]
MRLEVNSERKMYMIISRDQNIVRNGNIKIGDLSFEEVEKFKYLGAPVTKINDTLGEIKRRINMGNTCYCSGIEHEYPSIFYGDRVYALKFWSAYVPCSTQHLDAVQLALEQIDVIRRLVAKYPTYMTLVTSTEGSTSVIYMKYDVRIFHSDSSVSVFSNEFGKFGRDFRLTNEDLSIFSRHRLCATCFLMV